MASLDGKYKVSINIEYEIKGTASEIIAYMPVKEVKRRTKRVKQLTTLLCKMKKEGWQIENTTIGCGGDE